jgi:hypothetical protein
MDRIFDLAMIILPSGIVFITTYYLVKNFLDHESRKKTLDIKLANQTVITPIRLQAYERVILFLERINPNGLIMRSNRVGTAAQYQGELLKTIRAEFEHNLSQQIYMSSKAWDAVIKAKEETIKLINVASSHVNSDAGAMELAQAVIAISSQLTEMPSKAAVEFIKKEIGKEF